MEALNQNTVTEITVAYKPKQRAMDRPIITKSRDALVHFLTGFDMDLIAMQEEFLVLYLNQGNRVLGLYKASKGGITGTVVDIRIILSVGLKLLATSMMIAHNHPSGNLNPSRADQELTGKIKEAASWMDIKLIDHLIVVPSGECFSFADEGYL